ncbi:NAD(P)/FAD-dependent oxidoreductase [Jidongwangia harbinensis]|uniref:NAD(P)/FAD-dependent oxidoreductase n=1 Tax=Jidongwangia harbinensis TaxID=2878561 RepID=UPI001CD9DC52|nr:NAD(P)/FAD-dependent oxidoreductase [Jidongwangia harbinensis]MCA2219406.1 NAD(P)/FAD-dependent oxidoreductase [Jidongwangia harbinensis]
MTYDVVVIGGGPAGLSGAVALGRALRTVLVIDAGEPRNAPADGIHNYLTRDGVPPAEYATLGRAEVRRYGGEIRDGRAVTATRTEAGFQVTLADGSTVSARRLLVTTGVTDRLPEIPGLRERWGHTVLHCPYCHGYEVRGTRIGIIATTPMAMHGALLWGQWTKDVTLFRNDTFTPDPDQERQLRARGVTVVSGRVTAVDDDGVRLADGTVVAYDNLVVQTRMEPGGELLASLGLTVTEHPSGAGAYVPAEDPTGRTAVPGVWVAGNVADPMGQVITSAGAGTMAGAMINADLVQAETAAAVAAS